MNTFYHHQDYTDTYMHADTMRVAMTLYRKNIVLSQQLFSVINYFEVSLRNKIDNHYLTTLGSDWILNSMNDMFADHRFKETRRKIAKRIKMIPVKGSHNQLVAQMEFGFWRFLFATPQFSAAGSTLLQIFPNKPKSSKLTQYNHSFVFNELRKVNDLRNRIAHHEPICFAPSTFKIDTINAREAYRIIIEFFNWMNIDSHSLLYGLDHVILISNYIDSLKVKSTSPLSSP